MDFLSGWAFPWRGSLEIGLYSLRTPLGDCFRVMAAQGWMATPAVHYSWLVTSVEAGAISGSSFCSMETCTAHHGWLATFIEAQAIWGPSFCSLGIPASEGFVPASSLGWPWALGCPEHTPFLCVVPVSVWPL